MFVNSTITRTMITQTIEIASMPSSNPLTCVCFGGNTIWRLPEPLSIIGLLSSRANGRVAAGGAAS